MYCLVKTLTRLCVYKTRGICSLMLIKRGHEKAINQIERSSLQHCILTKWRNWPLSEYLDMKYENAVPRKGSTLYKIHMPDNSVRF